VSDGDHRATSAAELFDLLWDALADVLGTATAAIILRRAIQQAALATGSSERVMVFRNGKDYEYRVPGTWRRPGNDAAVDALRGVAAALRLLLIQLTGPVLVDQLGRLAPFQKWGIDFSDTATNA
jgi:hypothetical protein